MSDDIKVTVMRYPDRRHLVLAFVDPVSNKRKARSAKTENEGDAWKAAAAWEEELRGGIQCPPSKITWQQFRQRYETEYLASLKPKTVGAATDALNIVERHLNPDRLCKVNATALSTLQAKIKATGVKETTIGSVLRHVRAALGWAKSVNMLREVPKITMPKGAKGRRMKGGALVGEQFERMLGSVETVLFPTSKRTDKRRPKGILPPEKAEARRQTVEAWKRYLTGLWLSGLRLGESLALSWELDAPFAIDLSGRRPRFRILGEAQKSGRDELLPLTPDAAAFFLATPEAERVGPVFKLVNRFGQPYTAHEVGNIVAQIGKKTGVVVAKGKTASAHDLRRTFATRWAKRVAPAILQKLMRHARIETSMTFYVDLDADEMADELWANHPPTAGEPLGKSNISGNIGPESTQNDGSPAIVTDCQASPCEGVAEGTRTPDSQIHNLVL